MAAFYGAFFGGPGRLCPLCPFPMRFRDLAGASFQGRRCEGAGFLEQPLNGAPPPPLVPTSATDRNPTGLGPYWRAARPFGSLRELSRGTESPLSNAVAGFKALQFPIHRQDASCRHPKREERVEPEARGVLRETLVCAPLSGDHLL